MLLFLLGPICPGPETVNDKNLFGKLPVKMTNKFIHIRIIFQIIMKVWKLPFNDAFPKTLPKEQR